MEKATKEAQVKLAPLGKKYTVNEWVMDKFYRKFGNEELFDMLNRGSSKALGWWNTNIHHNKDGVCSNEEFKQFIMDLEKRKPKRFDYDDFGLALITCMGIF